MVTKADQNAEKSEPTTVVVKTSIDWSSVENLNDALAALQGAGVNVLDSAEVLSDGSEFIKDKDTLIGVPMMVLDWKFITDPKTKKEYANIFVMTVNRATGEFRKVRFNDGSTGVYQQLKAVHESHGVIGIRCKMGLRKSEYTFTDDKGVTSNATTYYLSTSA